MPCLLPDSFSDAYCRRHGGGVLAVLAAFLFLAGLGTLPMMDRDEPRFAHATVEMLERGSWAVPYFNGEYRFDKPPLTYWWMALHYKLLGVNELAARLHSVLAAWLIALVVRAMASAWWGARAGLLAGAVWLTTFQVFVHGRLAVADMPMVLFVTLAMWSLMQICHAGGGGAWNRWHWILYGSLGLGFLAKGPLALIVPGLALVMQRFLWWRKPLLLGRLKLWPGLLLSFAIVAAWGIPALIETKGLFWKVGMGEHVVERGTQAFNGRFPVPGYYFATAVLSLFPWIMFLPLVWRTVRSHWDERSALLVSWFSAPYVIFTFYATQLPHYVMPGFPAAALLVALALSRGENWQRGVSRVVGGVWVALTLVALGLGYGVQWPDALAAVVRHGAWLITAFTAFGLCLGVARWSRFSWLLLLLVAWHTQRISEAMRQTHAGAMLGVEMRGTGRLVACRFNEPSLVFHTNQMWKFTNKLEVCEREVQKEDVALVVLLRREWTLSAALGPFLKGQLDTLAATTDESESVDAFVKKHPRFEVKQVQVFNAARSSWAELTVMNRSLE